MFRARRHHKVAQSSIFQGRGLVHQANCERKVVQAPTRSDGGLKFRHGMVLECGNVVLVGDLIDLRVEYGRGRATYIAVVESVHEPNHGLNNTRIKVVDEDFPLRALLPVANELLREVFGMGGEDQSVNLVLLLSTGDDGVGQKVRIEVPTLELEGRSTYLWSELRNIANLGSAFVGAIASLLESPTSGIVFGSSGCSSSVSSCFNIRFFFFAILVGRGL
jgi:hypothetical protein